MMKNKISIQDLQAAIYILQARQATELELLKEQFTAACESLQPLNLVKNSLNRVLGSPELVNSVVSSTMGLAAGFLSKKIIPDTMPQQFKKIIGNILEYTVTRLVTRHANEIIAKKAKIF